MIRFRLISIVLALPLLAASESNPEQTTKAPVISAATNEVSLDLVVRDKHGRPVKNLSPSDIEVLDDGKPVKLTSFGVATAHPAIQPICLLFEPLTEPDTRRLAREAAEQIVQLSRDERTWFAVLQIGHPLETIAPFSNDHAAVLGAVSRIAGHQKHAPAVSDNSAPATGPAELRYLTRNAVLEAHTIAAQDGAPAKLAALAATVDALGNLQGRKVIVYFSEGLTLSTDLWKAYRRVLSNANLKNVSIYTVDATGFSAGQTTVIAQRAMEDLSRFSYGVANPAHGGPQYSQLSGAVASGPAFGYKPGPDDPTTKYTEILKPTVKASTVVSAAYMDFFGNVRDSRRDPLDAPLEALASGTGGRFIGDTDNLKGPMKKLIEDESSYYEATYAPDLTHYNGHFRHISVVVHRKGLKVQTRSGYFAPQPAIAAKSTANTSRYDMHETVSIEHLAAPQEADDGQFALLSDKRGSVPATVLKTAPISAQQQLDVLAHARDRALEFAQSLPNFVCLQMTKRFVGRAASGEWKPRDRITELLRVVDGKQDYLPIQAGTADAGHRSELAGLISSNEFATLLNVIFRPEAEAAFHWQSSARMGTDRVEVYSYAIARKHSSYQIASSTGSTISVSIRGTVSIDTRTYGVRAIHVEAVDIPPDFPVRENVLDLEYGYVRIGEADYLLPVAETVFAREARRLSFRNEILYRDYRKYGSDTKITYN